MLHNQSEANTILIAEDDNANGALLTEIILQETTCLPLLLVSAGQILNVVQHKKPSLFILDYRLPGINGLELYDRLHAMDGLEDVPTLIIGASLEGHENEIERRGLACLRKPFSIDKFLMKVETLLGYNIRQPDQDTPHFQCGSLD